MVTRFQLDQSSQVPLYRQLHEHISGLIRVGNLAHGSRLPATRELASQFGLNRTTVSAAYALLENDGLIRGHVGRGSFVHYDGPLQAPSSADQTITFASSRPAAEDFPMADFQRCCTEVIAGPEAGAILQLGSPAGYPPLRRFLIDQATFEGCFADGDDLVVTNGCQQAMDLLQRVLAPAGSTVIVEDPVYHGLRNVFERAGARLTGLPMCDDGIDLERLERVLTNERPRLLVLTPNFQNPTGATLSLDARLAIVQMVQDSGVTLVENDIYGELRYEGERLPTIRELDKSGRTILIRSFSKIAFPGLRVGWVIAPARIAAEIAEARQWCDLHTDHLSQAILLRFAETGRLSNHLEKVRLAGRERLRSVLSACARYLPPGSHFTRPEGGMNLWLTMPRGIDTSELLPRAVREGVSYLPGRNFAVSHVNPATLRLSFGGLTPARIESGVAILGRLFRDELERSGTLSRFDAAPALV
ncbi:MAG: PLP-dependent aminotransferase family protein [Bryobacteraceae bacterium]|nr:PLP-dependent aminotransferase family protein [Bryobacteraceae bacterium]